MMAGKRKIHPADVAARASIAMATAFQVYYDPGPLLAKVRDTFEVVDDDLAKALKRARRRELSIIAGVGGGRRPIVYAILPANGQRGVRHEYVPDDYQVGE